MISPGVWSFQLASKHHLDSTGYHSCATAIDIHFLRLYRRRYITKSFLSTRFLLGLHWIRDETATSPPRTRQHRSRTHEQRAPYCSHGVQSRPIEEGSCPEESCRKEAGQEAELRSLRLNLALAHWNLSGNSEWLRGVFHFLVTLSANWRTAYVKVGLLLTSVAQRHLVILGGFQFDTRTEMFSPRDFSRFLGW